MIIKDLIRLICMLPGFQYILAGYLNLLKSTFPPVDKPFNKARVRHITIEPSYRPLCGN